ncbi:MAG: DinB family protein [Dehalococcoidia bacterium]
MQDEDSVAALWAAIRAEQAHLRAVIGAAGAIDLTRRPSGGGWSVLEVLRHLLFAEQAHLGRLHAAHLGWSPLGYTPATMREARKLGARDEGEPSVDEVLAEWQAVHERTEQALGQVDEPAAVAALRRNLKHLRAHARSIERTSGGANKA